MERGSLRRGVAGGFSGGSRSVLAPLEGIARERSGSLRCPSMRHPCRGFWAFPGPGGEARGAPKGVVPEERPALCRSPFRRAGWISPQPESRAHRRDGPGPQGTCAHRAPRLQAMWGRWPGRRERLRAEAERAPGRFLREAASISVPSAEAEEKLHWDSRFLDGGDPHAWSGEMASAGDDLRSQSSNGIILGIRKIHKPDLRRDRRRSRRAEAETGV